MTENASCRNPMCFLGSLRLKDWAQEASDRGGQDKARKVRAVGRAEESRNFKHAPNIARYRTHIARLDNALLALSFQHPMSQR
jgi:hypothetical protein